MGAGGIGTIAKLIDKRLKDNGIPRQIICAGDAGNAPNHVVPLPARGKALFSVIDFGRSFRKYIVENDDPETIYHFHLPGAVGPLLFTPSQVLDRAVVTFHTTAAGFRKYVYQRTPLGHLDARGKAYKLGYAAIHERFERLAVSRISPQSILTSVSKGVKNEVEEFYSLNVDSVIPNGTRTKSHNQGGKDIDNTHEDCLKLLIVGRLVPQKGLFDGIDALTQVQGRYKLKIVGTGPLLGKLRKKATELNIQADFTGYVDEKQLTEIYRESDVLLMPSLYEGLPMVGLEGASYGLAIAATKGARVKDFVCPKNEEMIVEDRDIDALSDSISYFLNERKRTHRIGSENKDNVEERFTHKKMTDRYIEMYNNKN